LSRRLRSVLHRTLDQFADTRHAAWQAGRCALRATHGWQSLHDLRRFASSGGMRKSQTRTCHVR